MLILTAAQLAQLTGYAQQCYPEECCGLLLGHGKVVQRVWSTINSWTIEFAAEMQIFAPLDGEKSRRNRFAIAPAAILAAQKYARQHDLEIIGIYHSHPDYPAIPSEYDRAIAWEIYSYLILSVDQGQVQNINSWVLDGDRQFQAEPIEIIKT